MECRFALAVFEIARVVYKTRSVTFPIFFLFKKMSSSTVFLFPKIDRTIFFGNECAYNTLFIFSSQVFYRFVIDPRETRASLKRDINEIEKRIFFLRFFRRNNFVLFRRDAVERSKKKSKKCYSMTRINKYTRK